MKSEADHHARYETVHAMPTGAVQWTSGFWKEKFDLCHHTILPSMRKALDDQDNAAHFHNLYIAAGLAKGEFKGTNWSDGDCCKWMEAASHVYAITQDAELDRQLDELIAVIAKAQAEDGYLSTQIQLTDRGRWTDVKHHELYNMGHLMTAACVHFRATGKDTFLRVACRLGDYLCGVFLPRPPELAHFGFNPSNIMGAVDLYRATGEQKYLDLARTFVDMRGSQPNGPEQNQAAVPLRDESIAVGHAVTATYLYAGATDVYAEMGDSALLAALARVWEDVAYRKMYVTGAVGAHHLNMAVRKGKSPWNIQQNAVHESFGMEFKLPNSTGYNETCANIGHAMWNWRMLGVTGEVQYADVMEQVIYNSGLSGMSVDGTHFCYTNPLRWHGKDHFCLSHDTLQRWFTSTCYCCPPQVARTVARMHEWAYGVSDDAIWVHLYGSSRLETPLGNGNVMLHQETDYPWDGAVTLTVDTAPLEAFALRLRIPQWAQGATLSVNGESMSCEPGSYAVIDRVWGAGDVVVLTLPLSVRLVMAHPKVEEARNQVAVMRGPVVYCLEGVDLPEDCGVLDVHLSRDVDFTAEFVPDLLGGVTVLRGLASRLSVDNWQNRLYQDVVPDTAVDVPAQMVPYFAWNNRGVSEMTVWLPVI